MDPVEEISEDEIRLAIKNSTGIKDSIFIPESKF